MTPIPVPAQLVLDLRPYEAEWHVVYAGAGPSGDPIVLLWHLPEQYRPVPPEKRWNWRSGVIWRTFYDGRHRFRVLRQIGGNLIELDLAPDQPPFSFVQPLSDGRIVAVFSRSEGSAENATVFSPTGERLHGFHAGDAIEDVQVDLHDRLWISFFDECSSRLSAVYGCGLILLDSEGVLIKYVNRELLPGRHTVDIYATNVTDDATWIYYYLEDREDAAGKREAVNLPLVRIGFDGTVRVWDDLRSLVPNLYAWRAFAVRGDRCLLGSPRPHRVNWEAPNMPLSKRQKQSARAMAYHLHLVEPEARTVRTFAPVADDGRALRTDDAFGRGPRLFLRDSGRLFSIEMSDLSFAERGEVPIGSFSA